MFIKIGFLGHVFEVRFGPEEECDDDGWTGELFDGITGGSGGQFERFVEPPGDDDWEYEDLDRAGDRAGRFGFG